MNEPNLRFIHVPKTGGLSILDFARKNRGILVYKDHSWIINRRKYQRLIHDIQNKKMTTFMVKRNPYDRFLSIFKHFTTKTEKDICWKADKECIQFSRKEFKDFTDFVKRYKDFPQATFNICHALPMHKFYQNERGVFVDRVIDFENIGEEFNDILEDHGVSPLPLPHVNATYKASWRELYTPETKEIIFNDFKDDFRIFNYNSEL